MDEQNGFKSQYCKHHTFCSANCYEEEGLFMCLKPSKQVGLFHAGML